MRFKDWCKLKKFEFW
jgi:serine/threonine-protein phosphatase 2A regulatory subunit A